MESAFRAFEPSGAVQGPEERQALQLVEYLTQLLEDDPRLEEYIQWNAVWAAQQVFKDIPQFLKKNSWLIQKLQDEQRNNPNGVVMVTIPKMPLVLAQTSGSIVAMAPALGCSLQALSDLPDEPSIVTSMHSEDELVDVIWKLVQKNPSAILTYERSGIDPRDYLALGVIGLFRNEVFRMVISEKLLNS